MYLEEGRLDIKSNWEVPLPLFGKLAHHEELYPDLHYCTCITCNDVLIITST